MIFSFRKLNFLGVSMTDFESIQEAQARRDAALSELYLELIDGRRVPRHGEEIQQQKTAEIEATYHDDLRALMQAAAADKRQAEEQSRQQQDPTTWLTAEELASANSRAAFVKEDVASLAIDEVLQRARAAARNEDRSLAWLYLRYLPKDAGSLADIQELRRVRDLLQSVVIPDDVHEVANQSAARMLEAEKRRVAAYTELYRAGGVQGGYNPFQ